MMKIPKSRQQKNPTIVHVDEDVGDEVEDVAEAAMDLAKKHHAASDLLQQLVDQNATMTISKTMIWIPMRNWRTSVMSRKKKLLHHAATAAEIEAQGEIVDADVKNHDLLATVSHAKAVLNATIVDLVKIEHRAKTVGHVKNGLSGLLESQWQQNVLHAALLHAIAVKAQKLPVIAVTHEHLAWLLSSPISRPGKKRSVLCL
jgi:hypothetical protein